MKRAMALLLACAGAAPMYAQATFHGNNARTGVFSGSGPTDLSRVKWTFKTAGPIVTSPTVAGGVVYIASLSGHLYAIDQETGKEKWNFKSRLPIASSPTIAGDTVYFVSSAGSLAALDAATGKPRWVLATEYEKRFEAKGLHGYPLSSQSIPDAWDLFTSSPAVENGKVFFGSGDGNIYAADASNGTLLWKFPTQDVVHTSPAVVNNIVYAGSWDSHLYAIDAETGQLKWSFEAGQDPAIHNQVGFQASPAVADGVVYSGCRDAHVYALDAATGRKRWDYPTSKSWVISTPAVRDGMVYAGTSDSSRLMGLDARTGRLKFNVDTGAYVFSSPALAGSVLYVGNHGGTLLAIDAKSGNVLSRFQTEGARSDPMKLLTADGRLNREAFSPVFGDFQDMYIDHFRFRSVGAIMSSPTVDSGTVFFGSMDGNVYALN